MSIHNLFRLSAGHCYLNNMLKQSEMLIIWFIIRMEKGMIKIFLWDYVHQSHNQNICIAFRFDHSISRRENLT